MRHVVGHLTDAVVERDGVYATLHLHEDARWLRTKLAGLAARGVVSNAVGLSVDVVARYTPEASGVRSITSIDRVSSVDVVSSPSADGRFLQEVA